ncbi:hypothetical protein [Blastococcus sp. PRF04-17]|uniref:hypothetical protein n=1 Tax=Blastococcus sp. PRF04-17 TaxID=2933797 RepID=UPI001FF5803B|nr:hypothetical protein [Blastococcus sp. PRF04-17]UOY03609.1 hypothetical protein MVA48_09885 [Blastococcus sp. PRF04-17]
MKLACRTATPASDLEVMAEVVNLLDRRAAMKHPPLTLVVSDPVALGIAGIFASRTPGGKVLDRFYRKGVVDSDELIEAAQIEQAHTSPEGHAALYCLIGWVRARVHAARTAEPVAGA